MRKQRALSIVLNWFSSVTTVFIKARGFAKKPVRTGLAQLQLFLLKNKDSLRKQNWFRPVTTVFIKARGFAKKPLRTGLAQLRLLLFKHKVSLRNRLELVLIGLTAQSKLDSF